VTPLSPALTCREERVLLMLADGHGLREIATCLGVSWRIARRDRDRARVKLEAVTTTHAVAIVVRLRQASR
jgi:DNA-binding CsgD family transcriptional regulator